METVGWKRRKWNQQHKGDCHYRSLIKKGDCTCLEWGKPARTSLKEIKGLSSPFFPFIYSVNFSPCRKHLADSSVPSSPWCIPIRVYTTDISSTSFPFALLTGNRGYAFISKVCPTMGLSAHTGVGTGWGSPRLGDWTKTRQLMLLVPQPSSPPFGGCCHPWGSNV